VADDRIIVDIILDDGSVQRGFAKVEQLGKKSAKKIGNSFTNAFSGALGSLAVGFAAFAGIRKITRDLLDFSKATAEIRTITKGLNIDQKELNKTLIETSKQFGTSASEQAKSFYQIISAGITDAAKANDTLIAANKLAIGGLTTTSGAVNLLTSAVNAFGQENLSAARAADIIFGTVRLGKTRVEELESSLGQILPSAKALGVSFEDVAGALAQLTTKGVSTSEAVTQINAVLTAVLKKGVGAKKLFPELGDSFTLATLKGKGLSLFLKDLVKNLGGSEEKLTKLLGRAEGAKAILALAGDGFKGLDDKVAQLKNSAGAADEAFNEMNKTLGQQLNRTLSIISGKFLEFTSQTEGPLVNAVIALNTGLENLGRFLRLGAISAIGLIALLGRGPSLFAAFRASAIHFGAQLIKLRAQTQLVIVSFQTLRLAGVGTFTALRIAITQSTVAMNTLRFATNLFKAALTLGLIIVIDQVIEQLITLTSQTGSLGQAFKALGIKAKIFGQELKAAILAAILETTPKLAKFFGVTDEMINNTLINIGKLRGELRKLGVDVGNAIPTPKPGSGGAGGGGAGGDEEGKPTQNLDVLKDTIPELKGGFQDVFAFLNKGSALSMDNMVALAKTSTKALRSIGKTFAVGFAQSFAAVGAALAKGEGAFEALGKAVLGVLADIAIQYGTTLFLIGIGMPDASKVAAGLALITLGGFLKAVAGRGGAAAPAGGGGAGGDAGGDIATIQEDEDAIERSTSVTVNVEGTVLDPVSTGLQIAELLREVTDSNDIVVNA